MSHRPSPIADGCCRGCRGGCCCGCFRAAAWEAVAAAMEAAVARWQPRQQPTAANSIIGGCRGCGRATAAATAAECNNGGCRMAVDAAAVARPAWRLRRLWRLWRLWGLWRLWRLGRLWRLMRLPLHAATPGHCSRCPAWHWLPCQAAVAAPLAALSQLLSPLLSHHRRCHGGYPRARPCDSLQCCGPCRGGCLG
jgi:hypothetical protein